MRLTSSTKKQDRQGADLRKANRLLLSLALACSLTFSAGLNLNLSGALGLSDVLGLADTLGVQATTNQAYADVRRADVILGQSIDSRGLSLSQCPSVDAEYVYVCDDAGEVYFERNAQSATQIASITKVMCAIVALENAPLDTQITVSHAAAAIGESSAGLQEGDTMTLDQALYALMVPSGNDAAQAIAECVGAQLASDGQDAYDAFIAAMNNKATEIGMKDSIFENPHGLDFGTYAGNLHSTAEDVGKMCVYAMSLDGFKDHVSKDEVDISITRDGMSASLTLESTDALLGEYEGACGIKTGLTDLAGASFAGACEHNGHIYYAIVIHSSSEAQRFSDATTLFDWVFAHEIDYPLAHSSEQTTMTYDGQTRQVPVVAEVAHSGWVDAKVKGTLADPDASVKIFDLGGNISQEVSFDTLEGNVCVGDKIGSINFKQRNQVVATVDIVACEDLAAPDFFQGIGVWWDRLFRSISGQVTCAQSSTLNQTPLVNDKTSTQS